jgi:hypothetical protein
MFTLEATTWRAAQTGRWLALILGSLTVLFFLAFFFGEGPPRLAGLTTIERLQFVAMGSLFLGLAICWKWEGLGGLLALVGFLALVGISRSHLTLWALDAPAAIAAVHVVCWLRLRAGAPANLAAWRLSRNTLLGCGAALLLFLLLCANEMFGQPPLMTPTLRPSGNLLGTRIATGRTAALLTIHEDASVTGTIAGTPIADAHIAYGRSWFGKLMHWNADYVIRGRLSDHDFAAPLTARGQTLYGSLFLNNRPAASLWLRKP